MNQYPEYPPLQNQGETPVLPAKPPRARLYTGIIGFAITAGLFATFVAQVVIYGVVSVLYPALMENDWYALAFSTVPIYLVGMPISCLFLLTVPKSAPQQKIKLKPLMWLGFLFVCFIFSYLSNILGELVKTWFYNLLGIELEDSLAEMAYVTPFGANLLFAGILAPIFEELFYRKAIIDRLRRYGDLPAILISGLIFGLVHGNFSQVFYSAAIGMLLGFVYLRTGNVLCTIGLHAAFNIISGVYVTEILRRLGGSDMPAEGDIVGQVMVLSYEAFIIVALVAGSIFLIANLGRFKRSLQKGEYSLTFDQWMNALVLNPGVWVFLIWVAILFLSSIFAI